MTHHADDGNTELHEFLLPYYRLEEAVSRWRSLHYLPTRSPNLEIDLDGRPLVISSDERAARTKEVEEALVRAYMDLFMWRCNLTEREMVRVLISGEAADIGDAIMIGTTETQLNKIFPEA
jgi:hypothetical protein